MDSRPLRLARRLRDKILGKSSLAMPEGVQVIDFDGVRVPLDFSQHTHRTVFRRGFFEQELTRALAQAVRPGDVFLDIGTNFGWHTLQLAVKYPELDHFYAIEPSSRSFQLFQQGVEANGLQEKIQARQIALGRETGEAALKHFTGLGLVNSSIYPLADLSFEQETVLVEALDKLIPDFQGTPAIIKCDVEGSELDVLHGAEALLSGKFGVPPMWFLEANYETSGMAGYFPWQLIEKAQEHAPYEGYMLRGGGIVKMPHAKALRHGDTLVLAIAESHAERLTGSPV